MDGTQGCPCPGGGPCSCCCPQPGQWHPLRLSTERSWLQSERADEAGAEGSCVWHPPPGTGDHVLPHQLTVTWSLEPPFHLLERTRFCLKPYRCQVTTLRSPVWPSLRPRPPLPSRPFLAFPGALPYRAEPWGTESDSSSGTAGAAGMPRGTCGQTALPGPRLLPVLHGRTRRAPGSVSHLRL